MTRGWKIGLSIFIGLFLALMLAVGAGIYFLSKYGREMGEGVKRSQSEGENFGRGTDDAGCLQEALARNKKNNSITKIVSSNVFLATCLKESKPSQGFCEGVPLRSHKQESKRWAEQKCREAGQSGITCEAMFQVVQSYCENDLDIHNDDSSPKQSNQ